jgi:hypothetical protein
LLFANTRLKICNLMYDYKVQVCCQHLFILFVDGEKNRVFLASRYFEVDFSRGKGCEVDGPADGWADRRTDAAVEWQQDFVCSHVAIHIPHCVTVLSSYNILAVATPTS